MVRSRNIKFALLCLLAAGLAVTVEALSDSKLKYSPETVTTATISDDESPSIVLPASASDSSSTLKSNKEEREAKDKSKKDTSQTIVRAANTMSTSSSAPKLVKNTFSISEGIWKTLDPFLFCAFHKDNYPVGNGKLGPDPKLLRGRDIGSDFAGKDGWSMYHGDVIPGFPTHPHRGFETLTITRSGWIDHFDSMGAKGRYGEGDTQWMTAGKGMQHCEMFPLVHTDKPNPMELFQVWLNLKAKDKFVEPDYKMFWAKDTPILALKSAAAEVVGAVRIIAGAEEYFKPTHPELKVCVPPSASYASQPGSDVAVWDISLNAGTSYTFPKALLGGEVNRVLYFFEGDTVSVGSQKLSVKTAATLDGSQDFTIEVTGKKKAGLLILQGAPIGEPVAKHGPFVMNTQQEIQQAFSDYQRTQFGGWPFDRNDPTNGLEAKRYAKFPDGHEEIPE